MEAVIGPSAETRGNGLEGLARRYVEQMGAMCDTFLKWEREHMLQAEPTPKERAEHRETLKWLLRLSRIMNLMVADPDFPDHSARELVEHDLWRLNESWKMIYEPIADAEADKLLAEVFPE